MQIVSAQEKAALEAKREELYKQKIDVQERIRRAASLGDLNAEDDFDEAHDINVTPFIDVMLVLLIIFMVAAPLMTVGVPVRLPQSGAPKVARPEEPVVVTIDAAGRPFLGKTALDPATMLGELKAVAAAEPGRVVLVRGAGRRAW